MYTKSHRHTLGITNVYNKLYCKIYFCAKLYIPFLKSYHKIIIVLHENRIKWAQKKFFFTLIVRSNLHRVPYIHTLQHYLLLPLQSHSSTSALNGVPLSGSSPSDSNSNTLTPCVGWYSPPELSVASARKFATHVLPLCTWKESIWTARQWALC